MRSSVSSAAGFLVALDPSSAFLDFSLAMSPRSASCKQSGGQKIGETVQEGVAGEENGRRRVPATGGEEGGGGGGGGEGFSCNGGVASGTTRGRECVCLGPLGPNATAQAEKNRVSLPIVNLKKKVNEQRVLHFTDSVCVVDLVRDICINSVPITSDV